MPKKITSYLDCMKTNWDELSPERKEAVRKAWTECEMERINLLVNLLPVSIQYAAHDYLICQFKEQGGEIDVIELAVA